MGVYEFLRDIFESDEPGANGGASTAQGVGAEAGGPVGIGSGDAGWSYAQPTYGNQPWLGGQSLYGEQPSFGYPSDPGSQSGSGDVSGYGVQPNYAFPSGDSGQSGYGGQPDFGVQPNYGFMPDYGSQTGSGNPSDSGDQFGKVSILDHLSQMGDLSNPDLEWSTPEPQAPSADDASDPSAISYPDAQEANADDFLDPDDQEFLADNSNRNVASDASGATRNGQGQCSSRILEYHQSSGEMFDVDPETGGKTRLGTGYAGKGEGLNNPDMQHVAKKGPLPQGSYTVGKMVLVHNKLRDVIPLSQDKDNNMFGRDGFLIHGDKSDGRRDASEGCIIMPHDVREKISECGYKRLNVVR